MPGSFVLSRPEALSVTGSESVELYRRIAARRGGTALAPRGAREQAVEFLEVPALNPQPVFVFPVQIPQQHTPQQAVAIA